ncbi:hypothetical protein Tco_1353010 [Tanacetum coccineum]
MWIISRGVVLLIVLRGFLLHRSSINNSASLSNKFGEFYFIFKFGISGLLDQVVTAIADRIRGCTWIAFGGNTRDCAHLEKKRTRLQLYIQVNEGLCLQTVETASEICVTPSELQKGGVKILCDNVRIVADLMKP